MTGWRIGYIVGHGDVIQAISTLQTLCTTNPNSMAQWAAVEALNGDHSFIQERSKIYMERRDFMVDKLNSIVGLSVDRPPGAFYLFVCFKDLIGKRTRNGKIIANDIDFTEYLLEDHLVCVVPGCAFGIENHFRICYAYSLVQLEIGYQRIGEACESLVN